MITCFEAELLGALTGDGFMGNYGERKQIYMIQFTGDKRYEKEYFLYLNEIIQQITGVNPTYREPKGNTFRLIIHSKKLFDHIIKKHQFPVGKKENISVPAKILQNNNLMNFFIRGLFDTDGSLYFDKRKNYSKPYPRLIIYTTSHNLFKEVNNYLNKYFKTRTGITQREHRKTCYCIEIYGHNQLQKWKKLIGFSNLKHIHKLF